MEFSLWRQDGIGNRYAVSKSSMNANWTGGYVIQLSEGKWIIESDPSGNVYQTAQEAVEALSEKQST